MAKQSKLSALICLIQEEDTEEHNQKALNRIRQACKTLGLSEKDTRKMEAWFDYRDNAESELYKPFK